MSSIGSSGMLACALVNFAISLPSKYHVIDFPEIQLSAYL